MAATAALVSRTKNDRAQDLFLLAKGHYRGNDARAQAEHARRIVGYHNLYDISRMSLRDTAWVVVTDLFPLITERLARHGMTDFLISLGPHPINGHGNHPDGYFAGLIEATLEKVMQVRLRGDDGLWALPFPQPEADPALAELVASDRSDLLYRPKG